VEECLIIEDEWKVDKWAGILQAQEAGHKQHYHHLGVGL
jgi:hypothetical protein